MGVLIDASVLIEHERRRLALDPYLEHRSEEELFLSVVTASELLHGVHRAKDARTRARRSAWVEGILNGFWESSSRPSRQRSRRGIAVGLRALRAAAARATSALSDLFKVTS